jgi:hypothetical protein
MEIVGLKQKVDDDINKLICKFVGYQSKFAKELNETFEDIKELGFYDEDCAMTQIHFYAREIKLYEKHGWIVDFFFNKLEEKDITEEMQSILKLRFLRMPAHIMTQILFKCDERHLKILGRC